MIDLSPAQAADRIAKLLVTPESRTLDFKRISDKHKKIIETVCAFANSEGGLLALGVGDAKDLSRPLKKCSSNAPGSWISKKRVVQTRLRSECEGHFGLFAGRFARFGRTYPMAHA